MGRQFEEEIKPSEEIDEISEELTEEKTEQTPRNWQRYSRLNILNASWKPLLMCLLIVGKILKDVLRDIFAGKEDLGVFADIGFQALHYALFIVGGILFACLCALVWGYMTWRKEGYAIDSLGIHTHGGVLIRHEESVRWARVQSVEITQGIFARLFRYGMLTIETSGSDADMKIGLYSLRTCEEIREFLLEVATFEREGKDISSLNYSSLRASDPTIDASSHSSFKYAEKKGEERYIYQIRPKQIFIILFFSPAALIAVVGVLISTVISFIDPTFVLSFAAVGMYLVGAIYSGVKKASKLWDTRVMLSERGVRMRSGLATTTARTIIPGRAHGLVLSQPLMWRPFGWWRLECYTAANEINLDDDEASGVVIPVGSYEEVMNALWAFVPDLGTDDPKKLMHIACRKNVNNAHWHEKGLTEAGEEANGFVFAPHASKYLDPIGWKNNAIALTKTAIVMRWHGLFRSRITVLFHEHVQSAKMTAGILERPLGLASFEYAMAPARMLGKATQHHLDKNTVGLLFTRWQEIRRARMAHGEKETIEQWRARMGVGIRVHEGEE